MVGVNLAIIVDFVTISMRLRIRRQTLLARSQPVARVEGVWDEVVEAIAAGTVGLVKELTDNRNQTKITHYRQINMTLRNFDQFVSPSNRDRTTLQPSQHPTRNQLNRKLIKTIINSTLNRGQAITGLKVQMRRDTTKEKAKPTRIIITNDACPKISKMNDALVNKLFTTTILQLAR